MLRKPSALLATCAAGVLFLTACGADAEDEADVAVGAEDSAADEAADTEGDAEDGAEGGAAEVPAELEFAADTVDGGSVEGAAYVGEPTVFWFWAPWCTICRGEAPTVRDTAASYDGSVEFVGVAGLGEVDQMQGFVADTGLDGMDHVVDEDGSIWEGFGVASQPAWAFVDADGGVEVVAGSLAEDDLDSRVAAIAG